MDITKKSVLDFLSNNRVGVLCVLLKNGSPHAATVHFSHSDQPTKIFFLTDRKYKKCEALLSGSPIGASFVIGFDEGAMQTLQMDGVVRIVSGQVELQALKGTHFAKIVEAQKYDDDPDSVYLEFVPAWWRFMDYSTEPETRISSE